MSNNLTYGSHAYSPSGYRTHINNFPYSFETTVMAPSFGTHYTKLTHFLSAIGSITPASNYFIISFLAHLALGGVNVLRCSILGLHSLWSWMMWVQMSRGMPMMSAIVLPSFLDIPSQHLKNKFYLPLKQVNNNDYEQYVMCPQECMSRIAKITFNSISSGSSMDGLDGGVSRFYRSITSFNVFLDYSPDTDKESTNYS